MNEFFQLENGIKSTSPNCVSCIISISVLYSTGCRETTRRRLKEPIPLCNTLVPKMCSYLTQRWVSYCNIVGLLHHPFWLQLVLARLGHLLSIFENTSIG